jgi:hypothetical protein
MSDMSDEKYEKQKFRSKNDFGLQLVAHTIQRPGVVS